MRRIHIAFIASFALFLLHNSAFAKNTSADEKPRVFITDSESWQISSLSGGNGNAYASHTAGGARPQTAEIIKTFDNKCHGVVTNNIQDKSDYVVVLDHEGGKGSLRHKNKIAVFNHVSGDSVYSKSTYTLGGSVEDACNAITSDWKAHGKEIRAAEISAAAAAAAQQPKSLQLVAMQESPKPASAKLAAVSNPAGADIEIDGNFVGNTPSTIDVAAGQHQVAIKKSGFKSWERTMTISGGDVNINATLEAEAK